MCRRARTPRVPRTLALVAFIAAFDIPTIAAQPSISSQERIAAATQATSDLCREWFDASIAHHEVKVRTPVFDVPSIMTTEAAVALDAARACVTTAMNAGATEPLLREGLAHYLHTLVVERLFDQRYRRLAYAQAAEPLFGGFVRVPIRGVHRTRLTALRQTSADPGGMSRAFMTLERYLGLPRLQRALRAAATRADGAPVLETMEAALGQRLQWLFDDIRDRRAYDYVLTGLTSAAARCGASPCHRTRVVVERRGEGEFVGRLDIAVMFDDGEMVVSTSNARAPFEEIFFESDGPALNASFDPRGVLVVDRDLLDDFKTLVPSTNVNVLRWVGQWTVWLQHALLTHAYFF